MTLEEALREKLNYDPETGELTWTYKAHRGVRGKTAGSKDKQSGYLRLNVRSDGRKKLFLAHRVAWFLHYGEWPPEDMQIGHINGDRADNRICNLRLATRSQNMANARHQRNSRSPYKGVTYNSRANPSNPWMAQIQLDGKTKYLGLFATAEEAHQAYRAAALAKSGEFARFG